MSLIWLLSNCKSVKFVEPDRTLIDLNPKKVTLFFH